MVTFDSRMAGTPSRDWDAHIDRLPHLDVARHDGLLVVAAHPDDETLGAGGLIADFAARGLPVRVVMVTDGSPDGDPVMVRRRSAELHAAVASLAPDAAIVELGVRDGSARERRASIERDLERVIGRVSASTLLAAPWVGDGHRDHRVVGEAVLAAAGARRVLAYPIWMWHWGSPLDALPAESGTLAVDAAAKADAIARYRSQISGSPPMLHAAFLAHFARGVEVLVEVAPGEQQSPRQAESALPQGYFDALHARRPDPWGFTARWYEERKRALTLASLPRRRYPRALEIGCSIGVLTSELAERCDDLLAIDISPIAAERARERVGSRARVEVRDAGAALPTGPFDLIVLSEVGYYFTSEALGPLLADAAAQLAEGGELLLCHWRHDVADYPQGGDEVHDRLAAEPHGLTRITRYDDADVRLEIYSTDTRSVAEREGFA